MDLSLLDFGARYYDAYVGRWNAVDPLAHKYFGMSPYNYCGNDPVNRFDPDGNAWFQNTSTGEIYYNESYTQLDVGKGIMRGDSNWSYLADNDSFSILDSELLTQFSQFVQEDNNSFGVLFNAESAASTMDKVGLEFKPTQALVEVHTDTQSIAEGDIVVTLENEFCIVKDIEKGKYVPRDFKQTTSTREYIKLVKREQHFLTNTMTSIDLERQTYSYGPKSKKNLPIKEGIIEAIKTCITNSERVSKMIRKK